MFPYMNPYGCLTDFPSMNGLGLKEQQRLRAKASAYGCGCYAVAVIIGMLLCMLLGSCHTKELETVVELRDSINTKVVTNTIIVPDTQYVTLPPQIVERYTADTTSTLRTDFAISTVSLHNGKLHHVLRNLEHPIPVPVQHKETTRDSLVYREREVPVPVPVIKEVEKPLSAWQQARIWIGNMVLIAITIAATVWIVRKRVWWLRLFRKFTK